MQNTTTKKSKNIMDMFSGKQILIPIAALLLLAVFNLIADPSFYKISMDVNSAGNHVLSGHLINNFLTMAQSLRPCNRNDP